MISPPTELSRDRPLRVHVLGSSAAVLVEPEHGPRNAGTYGEQLRDLLVAQGIPTVVTHRGTWFGMVGQALEGYERDVRDHFPDVLVVNYGMAECQSNALPYAVVRHATTWHRTSRPGAGWYRRRMLPPVWKVLRTYQRWAAAHDDRTYRHKPRRFAQDLRHVIDMVRKDCGSLVLLLDVDPPGPRVEHWLPGTTRRVGRYNALLAEVADQYDGDVRLVAAGAALQDPATYLPDGLHRTPAGHGLTAELLCAELMQWLGRR
ncbi:MAG: SGNH/GDSL hydrolase family protein [Actinomycetota bacterium]|nr:SGNH/GDSL hydrolase family protein [Actinomycetota bacterium]